MKHAQTSQELTNSIENIIERMRNLAIESDRGLGIHQYEEGKRQEQEFLTIQQQLNNIMNRMENIRKIQEEL